jgi:hypothetical protein
MPIRKFIYAFFLLTIGISQAQTEKKKLTTNLFFGQDITP